MRLLAVGHLMSVRLEQEGAVAVVTLDRPEALNSFDRETARSLEKQLSDAYADDTVRAVVVTGGGERAFCTGADVKQFRAALEDGKAPEVVADVSGAMNEVIAGIVEAPKPVVAAVNGTTAGGGLGLALACDLRIAAQTARFLTAFMNVAVAPDGGTTWLLPRTIGWAKARELLLTNPILDAKEAMDCGLVNELAPSNKVLDRAVEVAEDLAANPAQAMAWTKQRLADQRPLREHLAWEREATIESAGTADFDEGISAFFDKRDPEFL